MAIPQGLLSEGKDGGAPQTFQGLQEGWKLLTRVCSASASCRGRSNPSKAAGSSWACREPRTQAQLPPGEGSQEQAAGLPASEPLRGVTYTELCILGANPLFIL